jgi:RecB family endonuclease NucS
MPTFRLDGNTLHRLEPTRFSANHTEARLEDILAENSSHFGVVWLSRQTRTSEGKRPDMLGISADGTLEIWELKRGRAPREILAQAMEYAAWAAGLTEDDLQRMLDTYQGSEVPLVEVMRDAFATNDGVWNPPVPGNPS